MIQIIGDGFIRARKGHTCDLCGHPIKKGTLYRRYAVVDDGVRTMKEHMSCGLIATEWSEVMSGHSDEYDDADFDEGLVELTDEQFEKAIYPCCEQERERIRRERELCIAAQKRYDRDSQGP